MINPSNLPTPVSHSAKGIGMVHQEFMLVPDLSLLENLILGREPMKRGLIDREGGLGFRARVGKAAGVTLDWM